VSEYKLVKISDQNGGVFEYQIASPADYRTYKGRCVTIAPMVVTDEGIKIRDLASFMEAIPEIMKVEFPGIPLERLKIYPNYKTDRFAGNDNISTEFVITPL
jgi:hypothetical protein